MCKCTPRTRSAPPSQSNSQFLGQFLLGGLDLEVYLDGLWGRRLKKVINFFGKKKCTPRQNPGYAYECTDVGIGLWLGYVARTAEEVLWRFVVDLLAHYRLWLSCNKVEQMLTTDLRDVVVGGLLSAGRHTRRRSILNRHWFTTASALQWRREVLGLQMQKGNAWKVEKIDSSKEAAVNSTSGIRSGAIWAPKAFCFFFK